MPCHNRSVEGAARFCGGTPIYILRSDAKSYTKDEIDQIANVVGRHQTLLVDLGRSHGSILMLVELGRRDLALQWTADAWFEVVAGWRGHNDDLEPEL
jgi:hypothetical protein